MLSPIDLVVAIAVGLILASLLFLSRMADVADVQEWDYLDDYEEGKDNRNLKPVPSHTTVFEITGPMFFAAADKILEVPFHEEKKVMIIEHFAGAFPTWLAPVQVKVLPISDKYADYAKTVLEELEEAGIRAELDTRSEKIN